MGNWSKQGNHLLFEAQRMICAGSFFPEFIRAKEWRDSGVEILNREIGI
jgi:heparan-sulfate lyase